MEDFPKEEFFRELTIKVLVQQKQFEQWLKSLFYIQNKLKTSWEYVYQEMFYIKFYETITEGEKYAKQVLMNLENSNNEIKKDWFRAFLKGLNEIKLDLSEMEMYYIEYRRHSSSHIFQDSYEYIQKEYKIKKKRNGKNLQYLKNIFFSLLKKYGDDKNIDVFLNSKLQPHFESLYKKLTEIHKQENQKSCDDWFTSGGENS